MTKEGNEMKKVVLVGNHDVVIYNFRKELIETLLADGNEVSIILPYGDKVELLKNMGCHYHEVKVERRGTNPFQDLKLYHNYKEILSRIKPDIVLTYTIKPNIYAGMASCKLGIPYIANITGLGSAVENKGILQWITIALYKIAFRKIQTVFFQNLENKQFFEDKKIAVGKHQLLPGSGVNLKQFKQLDYPDDTKIRFLFIARVMKEKGIEEYLYCAEEIARKYNHVEFHILGFCEEDYEERLEQLNRRGIIKYHGMQKDIIPFLKQSHCTIHPSFYPEGMSNVLLESAASGRPVITTDRSGCREIVDDKVSGFLFETKKKEQLLSIVEMFIEMPNETKKQMGLAGRKKVEKEFDRTIVVNAYTKEIEKSV